MEEKNDAIFHFEELPLELQEHILIRCDAKTLTASMPPLSKFTNALVYDEGSVWRAKCRDYFPESDWVLKKLDETWRQFYLRNTSFDWTLPVEKWSEEQLAEWARVNITKDTTPQLDWHQRRVAIWVRKVLNFSVEALITYQSFEELLDDFKEYTEQKRISKLLLRKLWAEIEIMKKSVTSRHQGTSCLFKS